MEAKSLSFAFIYFSESGLFKGLRRIQIKKFPSASARVAGCRRRLSRAFRHPISRRHTPRERCGLSSATGETITLIFGFRKLLPILFIVVQKQKRRGRRR